MTNGTQLCNLVAPFADEAQQRRAEFSQLRHIPRDYTTRLAETGVFRCCVPADLGGLQLDVQDALDALIVLARKSAAASWITMIGQTSAVSVCNLPVSGAQEVLDSAQYVAGVFAPMGTVKRSAQAGFTLQGKWNWGSGTFAADWIMVGALDEDEPDPSKRHILALVPRTAINYLDTWHAMGLQGTGSGHFSIDARTVPEHLTYRPFLSPFRRRMGAGARNTPIAAFPSFGYLALSLAGCVLGIARGALDDLADMPPDPDLHARVQAKYDASYAYVASVIRTMTDQVVSGAEASWSRQEHLRQRAELRLAAVYAMDSSLYVVDAIHRHAASASVPIASRMSERFRDIHVASQHFMMRPRLYSIIGGVLAGTTDESVLL